MSEYIEFKNYVYTLKDQFKMYFPEMSISTIVTILECNMGDILECFENKVPVEDYFKSYLEGK